MDRREFLKGAAWLGALGAGAGCMGRGAARAASGTGFMDGFAVKPMERIRVGVVGVGNSDYTGDIRDILAL